MTCAALNGSASGGCDGPLAGSGPVEGKKTGKKAKSKVWAMPEM